MKIIKYTKQRPWRVKINLSSQLEVKNLPLLTQHNGWYLQIQKCPLTLST